jgi:DNA-directed RNA polymerase subunit RPC12/RpoP
MMKIFLNCPQCGAEVNMEEDASAFRCEFCTSKLKPVGRKEVQSFYIAPNSTKETVGTALVNVLNRRIGRFKLKQAWLGYAPYWRVQGLLFQRASYRAVNRKRAGEIRIAPCIGDDSRAVLRYQITLLGVTTLRECPWGFV